jgi:hypothetical protein
LNVYRTDSPTTKPINSVPIGKITPSSVIRTNQLTIIAPPDSFIDTNVVPGQKYYYWASAVGDEKDEQGNVVEVESPILGPAEGYICGYEVMPGQAVFGAMGGVGAALVKALGGCAWGAYSDMPWLTVPAPDGTGAGIALFQVAPLTADGSRTATLSVADQPVTVTQTSPSPISIFPTMDFTGSAGANMTVKVTASGGASWQAVTLADWMTVSASAGSGNGTVTLNVAANGTGQIRAGVVTIGGLTYTLVQQATDCAIVLSPAGQTFAKEMATGSVKVATLAGCLWTAMSDSAWLTVDKMTGASATGLAQTGSGTISYTVAANASSLPRKGMIAIGGKTFIVNQMGAVCPVTISPKSLAFGQTGGTGSFSVTAAGDCAWAPMTADSWITIAGADPVTGPGMVKFSVAPNAGAPARNGKILAGSETFSVSQVEMTITPTSRVHGSGAEFGSVKVTAPGGQAWTAQSGGGWIQIVNGSGSGGGQADYQLAANTGAERSGVLRIGGIEFAITQMSGACAYTITPASRFHGSGAASAQVVVNTPPSCAWTAASLAPWATISSADSGVGSGTVTYSLTANTAAAPRKGTLSVAGQGFLLRQNSPGCAPKVSASATHFTWEKAAGKIIISIGGSCGWAPYSAVNWIVFDKAGGVGSGEVIFTVGDNVSKKPRGGVIYILDQAINITQEEQICLYTIAPVALSLGALETPVSVKVTAPWFCSWTAATADPWIRISFGSAMSGPGEVRYTALGNLTSAPRNGKITIQDSTPGAGPLTHMVTQASATCATATTVQPAQGVHAYTASTSGALAVTAPAFCPWTAASGAAWLTINAPGGGTGSGTVGYSVGANATGAARTGTVTISGQTFTLTQQSGPCP